VKKLNSGRGFSPGTPASSITKTGHHDIAEILLKVALNTINQINHYILECKRNFGNKIHQVRLRSKLENQKYFLKVI
jgi:hypothetical protein